MRVSAVGAAAFRLPLKIVDYTSGQDSGTVQAPVYIPVPFTITGEKFSALISPGGGFPDCYVDFWPSTKQTLDGTLSCRQGWPKLTISAPAF